MMLFDYGAMPYDYQHADYHGS